VVTARRQIEVLTPARDAYAAISTASRRCSGWTASSTPSTPILKLRRRRPAGGRAGPARHRRQALAGHESQQQARVDQDEDGVQRLEERHRAQGGGRIEDLERDIEQAARERDKRLGNRDDAERLCQGMGWPCRTEPGGLAALTDRARDAGGALAAGAGRSRATTRRRPRPPQGAVGRSQRGRGGAEGPAAAALQHPGADARAAGADRRGLGIAEAALPFVGELVQVRPEAAEWSGAIERVLHNFAISLLVQEPRYAAVSRYVNDTHLGQRLVYHRVSLGQARSTTASAASRWSPSSISSHPLTATGCSTS
jgi:uncharacterized protein YPO0396